jgi:hypothetical protein
VTRGRVSSWDLRLDRMGSQEPGLGAEGQAHLSVMFIVLPDYRKALSIH